MRRTQPAAAARRMRRMSGGRRRTRDAPQREARSRTEPQVLVLQLQFLQGLARTLKTAPEPAKGLGQLANTCRFAHICDSPKKLDVGTFFFFFAQICSRCSPVLFRPQNLVCEVFSSGYSANGGDSPLVRSGEGQSNFLPFSLDAHPCFVPCEEAFTSTPFLPFFQPRMRAYRTWAAASTAVCLHLHLLHVDCFSSLDSALSPLGDELESKPLQNGIGQLDRQKNQDGLEVTVHEAIPREETGRPTHLKTCSPTHLRLDLFFGVHTCCNGGGKPPGP